MKIPNKSTLILISLAFGISVIIFAAYRILFMAGVSEYSKEFISGCIGAVITICATWALLQYQTTFEITKDQLAGIFKEKLTMYGQFISFLNSIHTDGELTPEEMKALIEWASQLSLICRPVVIRAIYEYAFQVIAFGETDYNQLPDKQKKLWKDWMLSSYQNMESDFKNEDFCMAMYSSLPKIIIYLREDISHKKMSDYEENLDMEETLDELFALHSAEDIEFETDGSYSITTIYEEAPKKPRKSRAATNKAIKS